MVQAFYDIKLSIKDKYRANKFKSGDKHSEQI